MSTPVPHDLEFAVASRLGALTADSSWPQLEQALRGLVADLRSGDALQLRGARLLAGNALEKLGVKDARQIVGDAFKQSPNGKSESGPKLQGEAVTVRDVEPWPEPVDGETLFADVATALASYVWLPSGAATAVTLWVVHTHTVDAADVSPYLTIKSATKECGKTTLLRVCRGLVRRPVSTSNMSPSALFRIVGRLTPTLLIDEADTFARLSDDLRGILNAGHGRDDAVVIRSEGDDHEPRAFPVFGPKALAGIGDLPDTVEGRSVVVVMQRKPAETPLAKMRRRELTAALAPLQRQLARWGVDHLDGLRTAEPVIPDALSDRQADNWEPLLAIADAVGGKWPERARKAALLLSRRGAEDSQDVRELLLGDLFAIVGEREAMFSADLVAELVKLEGRPWPEFGRARKPITPTGLARLLRPFGLHPGSVRIGPDTGKGYYREALAPLWAQYRIGAPVPPAEPSQASQSNDGAENSGFGNRHTSPVVTVGGTAKNVGGASTVTGVTVGKGGIEPSLGDAWEPEGSP